MQIGVNSVYTEKISSVYTVNTLLRVVLRVLTGRTVYTPAKNGVYTGMQMEIAGDYTPISLKMVHTPFPRKYPTYTDGQGDTLIPPDSPPPYTDSLRDHDAYTDALRDTLPRKGD